MLRQKGRNHWAIRLFENRERRLTMAKDMLGQVVRELAVFPSEDMGNIYDLLEKLSGKEGQAWLINFRRFLRKSHCWESEVSLQHFGLQSKLTEAPVPSRTKIFHPRHYFKIDTGENAKAKIKRISEIFEENFIPKKEKFQAQKRLSCFDLIIHDCTLIKLISRLGGEGRSETTLWDLFFLMSGQPNGEEGVLLTNSYPNIFFIRDKEETLWAVYLNWYETAWSLGVKNIGEPFPTLKGSRIFFNR